MTTATYTQSTMQVEIFYGFGWEQLDSEQVFDIVDRLPFDFADFGEITEVATDIWDVEVEIEDGQEIEIGKVFPIGYCYKVKILSIK